MAIIMIEERIWNASDAYGNRLLSEEAKGFITHNGKYGVKWVEK